MRHSLRFLWNATKGHRLAPWRSPYLLWRIETYCGVKMTQIGFLEFWEFLWRERTSLWRFLKWTGEMERYAHPKPKKSVRNLLRAFTGSGSLAQDDAHIAFLCRRRQLSCGSPIGRDFKKTHTAENAENLSRRALGISTVDFGDLAAAHNNLESCQPRLRKAWEHLAA